MWGEGRGGGGVEMCVVREKEERWRCVSGEGEGGGVEMCGEGRGGGGVEMCVVRGEEEEVWRCVW